MRTIVVSIRRGTAAEEFVVDVLIDGEPKSFCMHVVLPWARSLETDDRDFEETFACSMAPRRIVGLVLRTYRGEVVELPVDLGEI